jgi:hypothetical protein
MRLARAVFSTLDDEPATFAMRLSFRRWRPSYLLFASSAYCLLRQAGSARTNNAGVIALKNDKARRELDAAEPRIGIIDTSTSSTSKRRAREES